MKTNIFDEARRKSVKEEYEADVYNTDKALDYALILLTDALETESRIEDKRIYCPELDMTVTPKVLKLSAQNAVVDFRVSSAKWGDDMYEQSFGVGDNTPEALNVAVGSFAYSFADGLIKAARGESADKKDTDSEIATIFGGKTHKWRAYFSDVVTIGDAPDVSGAHYYWNKLKKLILKRLGNQKICCVRIYLDRIKGDITGECRIDGDLSIELSIALVNEVSKWKVKGFASHKACFFICQEEETLDEYPYLGSDGRAKLRRKLKTAVDMFYAADTQEKFDNLLPELKKALNDDTLAEECYSLIPEMCAEGAFREVRFDETIELENEEKGVRTVYKQQLADYRRINRVLFEMLNEGVFGDAAQEIYNKFVERSAVKNAVEQIKGNGGDLRGVKMSPLRIKVGDNFEIR